MAVRAFYDMNDHPAGYRFVRMMETPEETSQPSDPPTVGLSTGWIPATVVEDYDAATAAPGGVLVKLHGRFEDPYREEPEPVNGMFWKVSPEFIRAASALPTIELSLVVVRFRDYWQKDASSRSHNPLNERLIRDVLEGGGSPKEAFGTEGSYEVFSIFASSSAHLNSLSVSALVSGLRGRRKAALYFMWPTQRPAWERPKSGHVREEALRRLMTELEASGVKTCWPHPWPLYREFLSKSYATIPPSEAGQLKVLPTVTVTREALDSQGASAAAASALERLQQLQKDMGREVLPEAAVRGVAKLTFAWMGEAVLPFTGASGLERALLKLLEGAVPEAECLVQERMEGVCCEVRAFCCRDRAQGPDAYAMELLRMKMHPPRHQGDPNFQLTSHHNMTSEEMAHQIFGGNRALVQELEAEVKKLAEAWLDRFRQHPSGGPHVVRIDFMVAKSTQTGGRGFEVSTVECSECGSATCGLQVSTRTAATLNECMHSEDAAQPPVKGFPKALPPLQQEPPRREQSDSRYESRSDSRISRGPSNRAPQSGGGRSRANGQEAIQERRPVNPAVVLAGVVALLLLQGRLVAAVRKRLPRLSLAALGVSALAAVIARHLRQSGSSQRHLRR
eukprot:TRINITY_DN36855_c0_g1_i1.p1 TRINITY_DN36855_c0_g1~~TRINITY_DN36855_c0_g1_i1.p1  ORF type:complete len:642 (-),score=143.82 TRINITY_DN36855_c0_g1_i1:21-1883(-)